MKRFHKKRYIIAITLAAVFIFAPLPGYAGIPPTMNYQGSLEDADGPANAVLEMIFAIYNVETGGGRRSGRKHLTLPCRTEVSP